MRPAGIESGTNDGRFKTIAMDELPITEILAALRETLARHPAAVLQAPPGAGKTTGVPLALLTEPWLGSRRIVMLEPRRLATRAAALRMAELNGEAVGQTVGYRMRMDSRVGPGTRIEVVTEGVFTRMLQSDPGLSDTGLVIFDEFHERSLEADLALALCREVQGVLHRDLRLLVMSATLETAPVAALLDQAPVLKCEGRVFPVETRYRGRPSGTALETAVAATVIESVSEGQGSILVFLPGAGEIRRVADRLARASLPANWQLTPLFGNLPYEAQKRAIAPSPAGRHKIVLATAIAETSLTIDGIRVVVDSGLSRLPNFDPVSGLTRLVTLPVTRASADQRRGRAGRMAPGICYRLWPREQQAGLVPHARPEILEADLASLVLELALWGVGDPSCLQWLDPPPSTAVQQARQLLTELQALDRDGRITTHGREMARLPLHPRLAHMVLMAPSEPERGLACDVAALLSERDILQFPPGEGDADLDLRLSALARWRRGGDAASGSGRLNAGACRRVRKVARSLRGRLAISAAIAPPEHASRLLAWAYPDRIAQRRPGQTGRFLLSGGRGAFLDLAQPLASADYLVAPALDGERRNARIFLAAAIGLEDLQAQFSGQLQWVEHVDWDADRQMVVAEKRLQLGALIFRTEALSGGAETQRMAALLKGIRSAGLECLPWTRRLRAWQARVLFLRRLSADDRTWPDVSDAGLVISLEAWLAPYLEGLSSLKGLKKVDLKAALEGRLTWRQQRQLDRLAPTHLVVPSGSRRPIDYSGDVPILAVRIQELFGTLETPAIADGRHPLLLHLLSPAGRPAQITRDLAGFWQNSYPAVRKELKGRYPKHAWPEDPRAAPPTARVRPR